MTLDPVRLQTLVLARAHTSAKPMTVAAMAKDLERFAPAAGLSWRASVEAAVTELTGQRVMDEQRKVIDREALGKRLGSAMAFKWPQLTDRILPALALGLLLKDVVGKPAVLDGREAWAAAIAARALGFWQAGLPPKAPAFCDRLAWERLELKGKVERLPEAVRALFLQRELGTTPAPSERLLRLLAARELGVMSPELRALRNALVRRWLEHGPLGSAEAADGEANDGAQASGAANHADFAADLQRAIAGLRQGTFGDEKVFISAAWEELRQRPAWRQLSLGDFKTRLLAAHHAGEVVLARADLVGAMDPQLVERSEIEAGSASFHFIVRRDTRQEA